MEFVLVGYNLIAPFWPSQATSFFTEESIYATLCAPLLAVSINITLIYFSLFIEASSCLLLRYVAASSVRWYYLLPFLKWYLSSQMI